HALGQCRAPTRPAPARPHAAPAPRGRRGRPGGPARDLFADLADGRAQVATLGHGMPLFFPRMIAVGSRYCSVSACIEGPVRNSYPRAYLIRDPHNKAYFSYRLTLELNSL